MEKGHREGRLEVLRRASFKRVEDHQTVLACSFENRGLQLKVKTGQSGCGVFFSFIYLHDHSCLADREQAVAMLGNWPKEYEEGRGWSWGEGGEWL